MTNLPTLDTTDRASLALFRSEIDRGLSLDEAIASLRASARAVGNDALTARCERIISHLSAD